MTAKSRNNNRGFSLVELLIVMGMLSLVLTAVYSVYSVQSRSAMVQDDVVELQQSLRIGMDQMSRDLRMAGYLACPSPIPEATLPGNNTGLGYSDTLTVLMASGTNRSANIVEKPVIASSIVAFQLERDTDVDKFSGEDYARIVTPQVKGIKPADNAAGLYSIVDTDRTAKTVTLSGIALDAKIERGDMLITAKGGWPSSVSYCLGSSTSASCQASTCPANQSCLVRIEDGNASIVASNMTGLQFRYLLKDGITEVDVLNAANVRNVRAVRIATSGQTYVSNTLSGGAKARQMASLVDLRNADKPCP
jgi:prepilin-type N-terminal cleavage/methylation domain-containing protein